MHFGVLANIIIVLFAAVLVSTVLRRLRLPPILGYLLVGMIVGPYGLDWIADSKSVIDLAEFGVVFLMFTIGLEFSLPKLIALRRSVLGLGSLQVVITSAVTGSLAFWYGFNLTASLVVAATIAMSSTAIVSKQLKDQLELNQSHGKNAIGVLLFQDLAVIPFLILIPSLANGEHNVWRPLVESLLKGGLVLLVMLSLGRWVMRPLFYEIAKARSLELFTLTVLLVTLSAAWLTEIAGLSLALGAFLSGMMLGETEYRHQIEVEIRPFRDVLLGLFFISIGMLLNYRILGTALLPLLMLILMITVLKAIILYGSARLLRIANKDSLKTALVLAQGGEFGFALLSISFGQDIIPVTHGQVILAALVFSMAISPFLIRYNEKIACFFLKKKKEPLVSPPAKINQEALQRVSTLQDHIIICGYGRVGQNMARFLERENFNIIAVDMDPKRVIDSELAGNTVIFGDSSNLALLKSIGLEKARALVFSFVDGHTVLNVLPQIRKELPNLPVLVRTRDDSQLALYQKAGATEVVPETLEASLMLSFQTMILLHVPPRKAMRHLMHARKNRYQFLHEYFPGEELEDSADMTPEKKQLAVVTLDQKAHAIGALVKDLALENVALTAVRRGGIRGDEPSPNTELREQDVLILYGTPQQLARAEKKLLQG
ncbi:MAG: potassium transporter [Gammaproteobacteria bacterium]|nr:potassium transporter [Gammaproteobacteria bacterium]